MLIKLFCEKVFKYFHNPSRDVVDGYEDVFDEEIFVFEDDDDLDEDVADHDDDDRDEDVADYDDDEFEDEDEDDIFYDDCFWGDYDCIDYFDDDEYVDDDPEDDYADYDYDEDDDPVLELQLLKYEERMAREAADEAYNGVMVHCSWRGMSYRDMREHQDDLYQVIMDEAS